MNTTLLPNNSPMVLCPRQAMGNALRSFLLIKRDVTPPLDYQLNFV